MLKTWIKVIRTGLLVFGVLLSFFAFIEVLRAYQTLYQLHPVAGYAFAGILAGLLVWLAVYAMKILVSRPPVLVPPRIGAPETASERRVVRFAKYLVKYMVRLSENLFLPDEQKQTVGEGVSKLASTLQSGNRDAIVEAIRQVQDETIAPALTVLDEQAEKEVRACVAVVMAGVTLSPYKAADLMIVVYRNIVMAGRIIGIYNSRPRFREQLRTAGDVIAVVATVNYINMGKNLIEGLASRAPFIGKYSDDIAQGIGAGFMTSVVGHAAMHRSRAFKGFDRVEASDTIKSKAEHFYKDVRDIFKKDILPSIVNRIGDASKETIDRVMSVLDETGSLVGSFVKVPIGAAVTAGTTGGKAVYKTSAKGLSLVGKLMAKLTPSKKKNRSQ